MSNGTGVSTVASLDSDVTKVRKMSFKRKLLLSISCSLLVFITIAIILITHWSSEDANGSVHVGSPHVRATRQAIVTPISITTSWFTTTLPGSFTIKQQNTSPDDQFLLHLVAGASATTDEQVAITVGMTPTGGISQLGDYNLRATQTDTYARTTVTNLPGTAAAFRTLTSPSSIVIFWPHGTTYAAIACSTEGIASEQQLQILASSVLANWVWK